MALTLSKADISESVGTPATSTFPTPLADNFDFLGTMSTIRGGCIRHSLAVTETVVMDFVDGSLVRTRYAQVDKVYYSAALRNFYVNATCTLHASSRDYK